MTAHNRHSYGKHSHGQHSYVTARNKVLTRTEAASAAEQARNDARVVVFTNGCFDILHIGHVRLLETARSYGDFLIVGVNSDESVRRLKGPDRPVVPEAERAEMIAALGCVDCVCIFDEDTPVELIQQVKPDVHVKGGDYQPHELPEAGVVEAAGGRVEIVPFADIDTEGRSTTNLIGKMSRRNKH